MIVNNEYKTVTVGLIDGIVSVNENLITVYPNPVNTILHLNGIPNADVQIFDLSGKLIINKQNTDNQIDVSGLQSGIYSIKITSENGTVIRKFIKQ